MRIAKLLAAMVVVLSGCRANSGGARPVPLPSGSASGIVGTLEEAKKALESPDWQTRRAAVEQLGELRDGTATTVPVLNHALEVDPNDSVREAAARVLGELKDPSTLTALARALTDRSDNVRGEAANALGSLGPRAAPAIPALIESLRAENMDSFPRCMGGAARALAAIGPQAIAALVDAGSNRVRYSLVEQALADMGPPVLPVIREMLAVGGGKAETAAITMRLMGPSAAAAVPALVEASREGKIELMFFRHTVQALGPHARSAVPRLVELLESTTAADRCRVAETLERVGDREAPVLRALEQAAEAEQSAQARNCILNVTKSLGSR